MLLIAGIGAFFVLLHLETARRFAPLMPEWMVTHWGITGNELDGRGFGANNKMPKRWGLRLGVIISLFVSATFLANGGAQSAPYVMAGIQIFTYLVMVWVYVQNVKMAKENPGE